MFSRLSRPKAIRTTTKIIFTVIVLVRETIAIIIVITVRIIS